LFFLNLLPSWSYSNIQANKKAAFKATFLRKIGQED